MKRFATVVLTLCIALMCTTPFEAQSQNRRTGGGNSGNATKKEQPVRSSGSTTTTRSSEPKTKMATTNATNWKVIGQTVIIASITTLVCILIAYPVAYLLSNKKYNKNKVLVYIFLLPMWINFVIRTVGLKALINGLSKAVLGVDLTATYPYLSIVIGINQCYFVQ